MNSRLDSAVELQKEFGVCPQCGCTTYCEECTCPNCEYDSYEECLDEESHAKRITIHNLRNEKPSKPYDIRVDRHNKILGNPFIMHSENEREKVIAQYRDWIHATLTKELSYTNQKDRIVWNEIDRLLGIYKKYGQLRLFCWCAPKQCHAEVIADLILTELNQDGEEGTETTLQHLNADLLTVQADYIAHQVNCRGVMGAGLALALRKQTAGLYECYRKHCTNYRPTDLLGKAFIYRNIISIFGQLNYGRDKATVYTNYNALARAFKTIHKRLPIDKTIAFPYGFGCGLANGDWDVVEQLIRVSFPNRTVYICNKEG